MATELNAKPPAYEEVVALKRAQGQLGAPTTEPKPDTPYTAASTGYNDPGHVNPALNPAPIWTPVERPPPVPVINDPGVVGGSIPLHELNKAATGVDYGQQDGAVTEDDIRQAAEQRLERLVSEAEGAGEDARQSARKAAADRPRTGGNPSGASTTGAKSGKAASSSRKRSTSKA